MIDSQRLRNIEIMYLDRERKDDVDVEMFVGKAFEKDGWTVEDTRGLGRGHSDLICRRKDETIYVEVKMEGDTLRRSQIDWFIKNTTKRIVVCFVRNTFKGKVTVLSNRFVPDDVWYSFLDMIKRKYGTTYGHINKELELALKCYVEKELKQKEKT